MEETNRFVAADVRPEDRDADNILRPRSFSGYIGQRHVKEKMQIAISAAKSRGEALEHVLLYGPPGLGKTALSNIIAAELGVNIRTSSGPALGKPGDLAGLISNLQPGDVLFIDEIHRLNAVVEEYLYPAMEDFVLDIVTGQGMYANSLRINLPRFTLIGATTRIGLLTSPLRDRFGIIERLELYAPEDLCVIVENNAHLLEIPIEHGGALEIARRSRGTPRIANRLLKRVRDYAQVCAKGVITLDVAANCLRMHEIDELGLDRIDRNILRSIIEKFGGGPVGLDTLAAMTGEDATTIEDVYEPYLLQLGFLDRTPRGRVVTAAAYAHLGLPAPRAPLAQGAQIGFFDGEAHDEG